MDRVINAGLILCLARTSFDSGPDCSKWVKAGHKPGSVHAATEVGLQRVGGYLSGTAVSDGLERRIKRNGADGQPSFLGLAPSRGLPSQHLSMLLVRSYRTFAPLPVPAEPAIGGVFLWHSPHGHPHWALPSKPGHRGARTFLNR